MDGCKVIVHDSEYDEYDQECEVKVFKDIADACYNLVMYEYKKGVTKNENNNNSKGLANII